MQQRIPVHGGTDRVDDEWDGAGQALGAPRLGDHADDLGGGQHAGLGGLDADVGGEPR